MTTDCPSLSTSSTTLSTWCSEGVHLCLTLLSCCQYAIGLIAILALSSHLELTIPRYDFILLSAILLQLVLWQTQQESPTEWLPILIFHLLGLILELFKTHPTIGSWRYPEFAYFKFMTVPLYTGFMYASVASFLIQWRKKSRVILIHYTARPVFLIAVCIYLNFFTHHFGLDLRWFLLISLVIFTWHSQMQFCWHQRTYRIPLLIVFFTLGLTLWLAENVATFYGAWQYPNQQISWHMVSTQKIISWSLLIVMSFVIVHSTDYQRTA